MKNIKIAFFDVDGTIIDMEKREITPYMKESLLRLKRSGVKVCMATGRPIICAPKIEGFEFDVLLTYNGSYCCNDKEVIYKNPINKIAVSKIIENASKIGKPVSVASESRLGANGYHDDLAKYYEFASQKLEVAEDFDEIVRGDIYQIMLACTQDEHKALMDGVQGAMLTGWWDKAVDIIPDGGGKGAGIEKVIEYYGFTKDEAIAFGDGFNDVDMLQTVGVGVAMGNATDEVKSYADEVCGCCKEDGIYHYLVEKGLIDRI